MPVLIGEQSQAKNILIIPNTTNYQYILALKYLSYSEIVYFNFTFFKRKCS